MDKNIIYKNDGIQVNNKDAFEVKIYQNDGWVKTRGLVLKENGVWQQFIGCNPSLDNMILKLQFHQSLVVKGILESFVYLSKVYGFELLNYNIGLSDFTQVNQLIKPRIDYVYEGEFVQKETIELITNPDLNYIQEDIKREIDNIEVPKGMKVKDIKNQIKFELERKGYIVTFIMQNSSNIKDDTIINIRFNLSLTAFKDGVLTGVSNYPINAK